MTKRGRPKHPELLTPREQEVLSLLREALTNAQIAERLGIGLEGVKYHVSEILSKLQVSTREEAARWREGRPWWLGAIAFWRPPLRAASIAVAGGVVVAAAVGIVLLAVLVWRGGDGEASDERGLFQSVFFVDSNHGWVSGKIDGQGVILATADGGETWRRQFQYGRPIDDLQFVDGSTGWAVVHGATGRDVDPDVLLHTVNGGVSWETQYKFVGTTAIYFATPTVGRALVDGDILETTDGGASWSDSDVLGTPLWSCFDAEEQRWVNSGIGSDWHPAGGRSAEGVAQCPEGKAAWYVLTGSAGGMSVDYYLYKTDAGSVAPKAVLAHTKLAQKLSVPDGGSEPGPWKVIDENNAWFVGVCPSCLDHAPTVIATHNGGASWGERVSLDGLSEAGAVHFVDSIHGWVVGTGPYLKFDPVILATRDGGQTWKQQYP